MDKPQERPAPPKRRIPNLNDYLNGPPPEGMKYNRQFVEKRDVRKTIMITKTLDNKLDELSDFYDLSMNSFINAVLTRFADQTLQAIRERREIMEAARAQQEESKNGND